jgi:hypothetical protein
MKHDEDLKSLTQSEVAANNMFTNHNPSRVIIYKAVEHYKNMTKASDVLFNGNTDNWQAFEDHLTTESVKSTIGLPCYQPASAYWPCTRTPDLE